MLHLGHEKIVAGGIQVRRVAGRLEVDLAEIFVPDIDAAVTGGVEHRDAIGAAHFQQDGGHLFEHGPRYAPWGHEAEFGGGVPGDQGFAKDLEFLAEELGPLALAGHHRGVVVPRTDDDIVRLFRQDLVALVHGRPEVLRRAVISDAVAVPAEIVVLHVVLGGEFVVPGFLNGADMVGDIAVPEDDHRLAVQGRGADVVRVRGICPGYTDKTFLRESGEREQEEKQG